MATFRKKVFKILAPPEHTGSASYYFDVFIISLIILNITAVILRSVDQIYLWNPWLFDGFEIFSIIIFTIEYLLRLWTGDLYPEYPKAPKGNVQYAGSTLMIIDLLAILPFYLPFLGLDLRFMRIMRLFRVFTLLRLVRFTKALDLFYKVYKKRLDFLVIFSLFTLFFLILFSILLFYAESGVQPDVFTDIPITIWWVMGIVSTVGFGEMAPVTLMGRFLVFLIAFVAIMLIGLSAAIIASGFTDVVEEMRDEERRTKADDGNGEPEQRTKG
jgi:voltage-gated potassium channel